MLAKLWNEFSNPNSDLRNGRLLSLFWPKTKSNQKLEVFSLNPTKTPDIFEPVVLLKKPSITNLSTIYEEQNQETMFDTNTKYDIEHGMPKD